MGMVLCMTALSARGDVLETAGGESLSGQLTRIVDGILVFRTSLKGQMMVPMGEVQSVRTDARWIITLRDGAVYIGQFADGGVLEDGRPSETTPLSMLLIDSAKLAPPLPAKSQPDWSENKRWGHQMATGVSSHWGTEESVKPFAEWIGTRQTERSELALRFRFDLSAYDDLGDYLRADALWFGRNSGAWSPFAAVSVGRNVEEAIDWRTGLTIGLRHEFASGADVETAVYGGFTATESDWEGIGRDFPWFLRHPPTEERDLRLYLGLSHAQPVWGGGRWDGRLSLMPQLSTSSNFRAELESALTYPLTTQLRLRLDVLITFEEEPEFAPVNSIDTRVGASVQFQF